MPEAKKTPQLPKVVKIKELPSGALSSQYDLTVGRTYKVRGVMGSCWVIETDVPCETCSIHPDHFESPAGRGKKEIVVRVVDKVSEFDCGTCAKTHKLGAYVAGHWDEELIHTCTCGAKHTVLRGVVRFKKAGKLVKQAA